LNACTKIKERNYWLFIHILSEEQYINIEHGRFLSKLCGRAGDQMWNEVHLQYNNTSLKVSITFCEIIFTQYLYIKYWLDVYLILESINDIQTSEKTLNLQNHLG